MRSLISELQSIPEFKSLPETQLNWLALRGTVRSFQDGDKFFSPGEPINEMRIILKGKVRVYFEQAGGLQLFDTIEEKEITGVLPYSRMKNAIAHGVAAGDCEVYCLNKQHFPEMVHDHYQLTEILVHCMTDRVRYTMKQQQINDKMMSLGKLSAGLAHELNNPSAAVVRGAHELKKHLGNLPSRFKSVIKIKTTDKEVDQVNDLLFKKIENAPSKKLTLSQKMLKEDELMNWLEDHRIDEAYIMSEIFAEFDIEIADLEFLKSILREEDLAAVITWISQMLTTERLVTEIEEASKRINALVSSIKTYTHMDRGIEKERADVVEGIKNTLVMLSHKLKHNNVKVQEDFAKNLPQPLMYVSMMNQVWTNLIDNAIDAMEGRPDSVLKVQAYQDREFIVVLIIDNGPGIPMEIQDKIFDSFFTTKPVGKGTGLGLEMVRQIVSQHNGRVDVKSVPGRTEFKVCIPIG